MIDQLIQTIQDFLLNIFVHKELVILFIAILPIVEARLAVPMSFAFGLEWWQAFVYSFIGSVIIAPLLLLVLIPFIKWLSKTRLFKKIGTALYSKFENKSKQIDPKANETKKFWGLLLFVAIPLPLTGVWTGCAVGSILKMRYPSALLAVTLGNLIATSIMTVLCAAFSQTVINYIITAIGIIAIAVVIALIIKIICFKQPQKATEEAANTENQEESL